MSSSRRLFRSPTPRERGFTMPAEWARHEGTWLAWPHDETTWPGCLEEAEQAICAFAVAVSRGERVHLLVTDRESEQRAAWCLNAHEASRVVLHRVATADAWIRDYGPVVVARGRGPKRERLALDFQFNAWGGKYDELLVDDGIPRRLKRIHGLPAERTRFVLEGGSIDVNGRGSLLTTEQCLLGANRNPQFTKEEIELHLREWLGVHHILWLGRGIEGDDTDGHVDDIARFVGPSTVVCAVSDDPYGEDHEVLKDNRRRLEAMSDESGNPLTVLPLPMPEALWNMKDERVPASYANFYIANRVVCVPTFDDPADAKALRLLRRCFPKRVVVPIDCSALVVGMGALHCVSQQLPA